MSVASNWYGRRRGELSLSLRASLSLSLQIRSTYCQQTSCGFSATIPGRPAKTSGWFRCPEGTACVWLPFTEDPDEEREVPRRPRFCVCFFGFAFGSPARSLRPQMVNCGQPKVWKVRSLGMQGGVGRPEDQPPRPLCTRAFCAPRVAVPARDAHAAFFSSAELRADAAPSRAPRAMCDSILRPYMRRWRSTKFCLAFHLPRPSLPHPVLRWAGGLVNSDVGIKQVRRMRAKGTRQGNGKGVTGLSYAGDTRHVLKATAQASLGGRVPACNATAIRLSQPRRRGAMKTDKGCSGVRHPSHGQSYSWRAALYWAAIVHYAWVGGCARNALGRGGEVQVQSSPRPRPTVLKLP
eukprot:gene4352-biopygen1493